MEVSKTKLDGVLLIKPPTIFEDFRGSYVETYNEKMYTEAGIDVKFVQDDISVSSRHVLRGIHGDDVTWKLVSCLYGKRFPSLIRIRVVDNLTNAGKDKVQRGFLRGCAKSLLNLHSNILVRI